MSARVLRIVALTSVALFGVVAGLFVAGETFIDPGGWEAAVLTAAWALPSIALGIMALLRPGPSATILALLLALVAGWVVVDSLADLVDRDAWGPVGSISMLALLIPCGLLGAHRAAVAGRLLLAGAAAQFVATVVTMDRAGGQSLWSAFGGSTGVLVLPFLVFSVLFLAVGAAERRTGHAPGGTRRLDHSR